MDIEINQDGLDMGNDLESWLNAQNEEVLGFFGGEIRLCGMICIPKRRIFCQLGCH